MLRKLAVVAVIVGLAPAGAWAASGADQALSFPPTSSRTPTFLDQFFAQATVDQAGPETQPDNGATTTTPPEHYTESSGTTIVSDTDENTWGPQAGNWEATLTGTGAGNSRLSKAEYGLTASVGYYFTRNWELSLRQSGSFGNSPNGIPNGSSWTGSTLGAIDFNIPIGRFVPFVGIDGGTTYGQHSSTLAIFSGEGGLKFYIYPKTFVFGQFGYEWPTHFSFLATGNFDFSVGVGFNF